MPNKPSLPTLVAMPVAHRPLLSVEDVAEWLGVSAGWVREHASGRKLPHLRAVKLGTVGGKGLWKFREEDIEQFIRENLTYR